MYWGCGLEILVTQVLDWLCHSYLVLVPGSFWIFFFGGGEVRDISYERVSLKSNYQNTITVQIFRSNRFSFCTFLDVYPYGVC